MWKIIFYLRKLAPYVKVSLYYDESLHDWQVILHTCWIKTLQNMFAQLTKSVFHHHKSTLFRQIHICKLLPVIKFILLFHLYLHVHRKFWSIKSRSKIIIVIELGQVHQEIMGWRMDLFSCKFEENKKWKC